MTPRARTTPRRNPTQLRHRGDPFARRLRGKRGKRHPGWRLLRPRGCGLIARHGYSSKRLTLASRPRGRPALRRCQGLKPLSVRRRPVRAENLTPSRMRSDCETRRTSYSPMLTSRPRGRPISQDRRGHAMSVLYGSTITLSRASGETSQREPGRRLFSITMSMISSPTLFQST